MPVLAKAVAATPQYLFPNRMICGFGDTHPGYLNTNFFIRMIQNAQANGKKEQERYFTALLKCLNPVADNEKEGKKNVRVSVNSFFEDKPLVLDPKVQAGKTMYLLYSMLPMYHGWYSGMEWIHATV